MPEYIEREALIKDIESRRLVFKTTITVEEALLSQGNVIRKAIEEAPAADVKEVVRCKDCQFYNLVECYMDDIYSLSDNDFCSYGKRKEGAEK